ncbi:ABC transporter substrate-binding protein [Ureibacillus sp. FSL W8-0352]|uniref:ABC transporter substrate-binding protein n=1 Tax=Ureibacillus sp. FSL W8-0352 TaxID=2954596 RepID=UPI0030F5D035
MNNKENGTSQETDLHKSDYLCTVVDGGGVEITFEQVPERVVSLQPSNTEILYELGIGNKVIGVTEYDKWPEEVQHVEKVSDITTVNVERVIELNPDLLISLVERNNWNN